MASTMVPEAADRPDVLPSERLLANGMAIPGAARRPAPHRQRAQRHLGGARCGSGWRCIIGGAVWIDQWWSYLIAFVLMGPMYARFAILMHEAAHKLLFTNKRWNDLDRQVGRGLPRLHAGAALPAGALRPPQGRVRARRARHGVLLARIRCTRRALLRRLFRDAVGISGWKNFVPLVKNTLHKPFRPIGLSIFGVQAVLWAVMWAATGRWWIYPLLWFLPWMTEWRVINRLRSIAEHGGMERSPDRRATTHNVRQSWLGRFWIVPYNTGWHLAHHVDMGVPWRNLPAYHAELERAGYVTDAITYKSYWALWKALSQRGRGHRGEGPGRRQPEERHPSHWGRLAARRADLRVSSHATIGAAGA